MVSDYDEKDAIIAKLTAKIKRQKTAIAKYEEAIVLYKEAIVNILGQKNGQEKSREEN
jgi:hypothetical protein